MVLPCPMTRVVRRLRTFQLFKRNLENVLHEVDQGSRARLLATVQKESAAWLNAFPVSSLGTLLDSGSFRVAINYPQSGR